MKDFIAKLVSKLEISITDLDDVKKLLAEEEKNFNNYDEIVNYIALDVRKVGNSPNQEIIINDLVNINSNEMEYKAFCYLLESNDEKVKSLPQYRNARIYLETLINYLKRKKEEYNESVLKLDNICHDKEINKKYYEILQEDNPYVVDIDEFINLLEKENVMENDKIEILSYIIKSNVINYQKN